MKPAMGQLRVALCRRRPLWVYMQRLMVLFMLSSFVRRSGGHAVSSVCWVAFRVVAGNPSWVVGVDGCCFAVGALCGFFSRGS